jgi:sugar fermentation stimulation protein A
MSPKRFFRFSEPLLRGEVLSRPNRFLMMVKIGESVHEAHCPATGKIFNIDFKQSKKIACLVSEVVNSPKRKRKTNYTVEALSFDLDDENLESCAETETRTERRYVGINQIQANRYIEYFLSQNLLPFVPVEASAYTADIRMLNHSVVVFCVADSPPRQQLTSLSRPILSN